MNLQSSILFPDGTQLFTKFISSVQVDTSVPKVVNVGVGGVLNAFAFTAVDAGAAWLIMQQINDAINGVISGEVVLNNNPSSYVITSISPVSFDITSDTLTIRGTGFTGAANTKLWIEDWPGSGMDSNGYNMLCTYVNSTTLTALFLSVGDGILSSGVAMYIQDSTNVQSNIIEGSNPSGTLITIP